MIPDRLNFLSRSFFYRISAMPFHGMTFSSKAVMLRLPVRSMTRLSGRE